MTIYSRIVGAGAYLPGDPVGNDELIRRHGLDSDDEWIVRRTGIRYRHIAEDGVGDGRMGLEAARRACKAAGIAGADVEAVLLATGTPDNYFPATAAKIQAGLGARGPAFDLQAVCAGFVFALAQADLMIRHGAVKSALVIGSELNSRFLDWKDRSSCVLFGDGAGAVAMVGERQNVAARPSGVIATRLGSDGGNYYDLYVNGGFEEAGKSTGTMVMNGREVFRHAVDKMSSSVIGLLDECGLSVGDIDVFVPHQANIRIMSAVALRIGITRDKLVEIIADYANVSSATIPIALTRALEKSVITEGDLVAISALGAGFAWGGALVRW